MTAVKPPAGYTPYLGARAGGFATVELHHYWERLAT